MGMAAAMLSVPEAALAEHRTYNYGVVAVDFAFRGIPRVLPEGTYDTRFINIGQAPHVIVPVNLGTVCANLTRAELIDAFDLGPVGFFERCDDASVVGDGIFALGGERARGSLTLTPGRTVFACFVGNHYRFGMMSETQVLSVG